MSFSDYLKIANNGFELPDDVEMPDKCLCGNKDLNVGIGNINCPQCGRYLIMWFVPLKKSHGMFTEKKKQLAKTEIIQVK